MSTSPPSAHRLHLQFFARLREEAGCSALELETCAPTPAALYEELQRTRGLRVPRGVIRVAVNARYATMETPLRGGDTVVFIPPVAGG
ncbi:MAG TPA: molybdopterin converting factor subunit 1 [Candidatus Didemnitutus sp.]|jgi:molybdopterin converting factor subunit 1